MYKTLDYTKMYKESQNTEFYMDNEIFQYNENIIRSIEILKEISKINNIVLSIIIYPNIEIELTDHETQEIIITFMKYFKESLIDKVNNISFSTGISLEELRKIANDIELLNLYTQYNVTKTVGVKSSNNSIILLKKQKKMIYYYLFDLYLNRCIKEIKDNQIIENSKLIKVEKAKKKINYK